MSREFLNSIKAGAIQTWNQHSVLPSVVGAQGALESGWGTSGLSLPPHNNLFGIKASSDWTGRTVTMPTKEWLNGGWVTINASFRSYNNPGDSVRDHGAFFTNTPWRTENYKHVVGETDYKKACRALQSAGYATDQQYAQKLINIIETWNLQAWDQEALSGTSNPVVPGPVTPAPKEVGGPPTQVAVRDVKDIRIDIIGDEHARQSFDQIRTFIPRSGFITRTGRDMNEVIDKASEYVAQDNLRDIVVIIAGTHGGVTNFQINELVGIIGSQRKVLLVDTASDVPHVDRVIAEYSHASTRFNNVFHGAWNDYSKSMKASWYSQDTDGNYLHKTEAGKVAFAEWLAESIYEVATGDFSGRTAKTAKSDRVNIRNMELKTDGTLTFTAFALQQDGTIEETKVTRNIGIKGLYSPLGDDSIYNSEANERWGFGSSVNTSNWIEAKLTLDDEGDAVKLVEKGARELLDRSNPHVQYTINLLDIDPSISVGDTGIFIDHEWNPPLYIEARVLSIATSRTNKALNQVIIGNVKELYPQDNGEILALQRQLEHTREDLRREWIEGQTIRAEMTATDGLALTPPDDDSLAGMESTQLQVRVYEGNVDITDRFPIFRWERLSGDSQADEEYNSTLNRTQTGNFLTVYAGDIVGDESTFVCRVYNRSEKLIARASVMIQLKIPGPSPYEAAVKNGFEGTEVEWLISLKGEDGDDGMPGDPGKDGMVEYLHIAYSNSSDGVLDFSTEKAEGQSFDYMGTATTLAQAGSPAPEDPKDPSVYSWIYVKGDKGKDGYTPIKGIDYFDGQPGDDGTSTYLWVRYSQNANGNPMTTDPTDAVYIGIATTETNSTPQSYTSYRWTKIAGEDGLRGEPGADGESRYLHIRYSNDGTTFTGNSGRDVGDYIGMYVDDKPTGSTNFNDYTWNLIKGKDGETTYFHRAFADDLNGGGLSTTESLNKKFMGTYSSFDPVPSQNYQDYQWQRMAEDYAKEFEDELKEKAPNESVVQVVNEISSLRALANSKIDADTFNQQSEEYRQFLTMLDTAVINAEALAKRVENANVEILNDLQDQAERWLTQEGYIQIDGETNTFTISNTADSSQIIVDDEGIKFMDGGVTVGIITGQYLRIMRGIFAESVQIDRFKFEPFAGDRRRLFLSYLRGED